MDKILIALAVLGIGLGVIYFTKQPNFIYIWTFGLFHQALSPTNSLTNPEIASPTPLPAVLSEQTTSVQQQVATTVEDFKDQVYQTAQTSLSTVFGKPPISVDNPTVEITPVTSPLPLEIPIMTIDLSQPSSFKLSLNKNTKYYFKFPNLPANQCLFIKGDKYQLNSGLFEVHFTNPGKFPIKTSSCDIPEKDLGELEVK